MFEPLNQLNKTNMKTTMNQKNQFSQLLKAVLFLLFCFSCSNDDVSPELGAPNFTAEEALDFNSAVANLAAFSQPVESSIVETDATAPKRDSENSALECATKTYKGAPGFNEMFTLDPTTDVIYPGALLKGESIPTGEYIGINADRAPITLSTSLSNINGSPGITINNPNSLFEVREGINELLSREVTGATPAELIIDEAEVYSEEHLSVALGANYRGATTKVSGSLNFNTSEKKYKYVLKFIQRYFTLDLDSPGKSPSDLFTDLPSIQSLGSTSPVYVSSVTYGRMVLYTVESDSTISQVKAALDAARKAGPEVEFKVDSESEEIIKNSNIKALVIGGAASSAAEIINSPKDVYDFIAEGGNYSKDSPGAPLAYKLRYVKEGFPVAKVILSTEYQIRDCDVAYPEYLAVISKITGTQPSDTEVNGKLRIKMWVGGKRLDINNNGIDDGKTWNVDKRNSVDVQNDKTHTINDHSYTFKPYRPNPNNDYVECSGELYDYNGLFGNESLGNAGGMLKIYLNSLEIDNKLDTALTFRKGISAHFEITRIK
jgi:thiol-activated cytolysin